MHVLAVLHAEQGRRDVAVSLVTAALKRRRRVLGDEHEKTLITTGVFAIMHTESGRYEDAASLLLDARRIADAAHGSSHNLSVEPPQKLIDFDGAWNKPTEAAKYGALLPSE